MYCLSLIHAVSSSSEMSKILFIQYFSHSRTNYKFVTPLSFHQNNNYPTCIDNYIQNHWPITLQNRPAEARAFFADHPTAEAKSPGYEVGDEYVGQAWWNYVCQNSAGVYLQCSYLHVFFIMKSVFYQFRLGGSWNFFCKIRWALKFLSTS
jgi:hypothetical protein